jgi:hypothetical protein
MIFALKIRCLLDSFDPNELTIHTQPYDMIHNSFNKRLLRGDRFFYSLSAAATVAFHEQHPLESFTHPYSRR